jgi:hypothetical protein
LWIQRGKDSGLAALFGHVLLVVSLLVEFVSVMGGWAATGLIAHIASLSMEGILEIPKLLPLLTKRRSAKLKEERRRAMERKTRNAASPSGFATVFFSTHWFTK